MLGVEFQTAELEEALHVPLRDLALPPNHYFVQILPVGFWTQTPKCPRWPPLSCQIGRKLVYYPQKRDEV